MEETRYSGSLIDDYSQLRKAWPHRLEVYGRMSCHILSATQRANNDTPKILDAGCGDCEALEILVRDFIFCYSDKKQHKIDALDFGPKMLARAKQRMSEYNLSPPISYIEEDLTSFLEKTPDNTYDVVTSGWTIHNFSKEKRKKTVSEIQRVLTPYGRFVWMDKIFPDSYDDNAVRLLGANFMRYLGTGIISSPHFKDFLTHEFNDIADGQRLEEGEVRDLLRAAGFKSFRFDNNFYKNEHCFEKIFVATK